jgi:hypothetical protein
VRLDVQPTHTLTDLHGRLPRARTAVTASVVRDMWREGWERRLDPGPEAPFGPLPLHICWPGRLRRSVDLCEPKARVRERCLGRTYCGRSMAAVSVECVTCRAVGTVGPVAFCLRSVSETVPRALCMLGFVFSILYRTRTHAPHARGANAPQHMTTLISLVFCFLPRRVRTCAASSCCTRSLSGGNGAVSK